MRRFSSEDKQVLLRNIVTRKLKVSGLMIIQRPRKLTDLCIVSRAHIHRSCLTTGLCREFHGWVGPSGSQVPEWASGITVGRYEIRLGVMRGFTPGRVVDSQYEKTEWRSARSMGRRGAWRRLSRMHVGNPPWRECADDNVEYGNIPFAKKRLGLFAIFRFSLYLVFLPR